MSSRKRSGPAHQGRARAEAQPLAPAKLLAVGVRGRGELRVVGVRGRSYESRASSCRSSSYRIACALLACA